MPFLSIKKESLCIPIYFLPNILFSFQTLYFLIISFFHLIIEENLIYTCLKTFNEIQHYLQIYRSPEHLSF